MGRLGTNWVLGGCALLVMLAPSVTYADVVNGDFDAGLSGWHSGGEVGAPAGTAVLGDGDPGYAWLYQGVALGAGNWVLEFDVLFSFSEALPDDPFAFPDMFAASLYLFDVPSPPMEDFSDFLADGFWEGPPFCDAVALLSADFAGIYENAGVLTPGPSPEWLRFRYEFYTDCLFGAPVFEFFGFNTFEGDGWTEIDNVRLARRDDTVIPEPASVVLLMLGLAGTARAYRRALS